MHPALRFVDHRPWPLPRQPWWLRMGWLDLAFLHYSFPPEILRARLPAGLELDLFNGEAWVGLVPFTMADVRPRILPSVSMLTTFPEVNLRTYVVADGKPGVWFFSLDAASRMTVFGGRHFLNLPYHFARLTLQKTAGWLQIESERRRTSARFHARYRPRGDAFFAPRGSFAHWASERYCLYSCSPNGRLARVQVHHLHWPLQEADVEIDNNTLFAAAGLPPPETAPISHFSAGVEVVAYGPEAL